MMRCNLQSNAIRCRALALGSLLMFAALSVLAPVSASALPPGEQLADPKLETRARELGRGLRCLVCQNQTIDDSDAPLARDLRFLVRERLQAGDDNEAVMRFVVARYGDFVLMRPPMDARTILLWISPFMTLALGGVLVWRMMRRRMAVSVSAALTTDEKVALDALFKQRSG
jgi:cytochrome c-type biogenesis protein CcmH